MKKYLLALLIVAAFAACNSKPSATVQTDLVVLTPGNKMHVYSDDQSDKRAADPKSVRITRAQTQMPEVASDTPVRIDENISKLPPYEITAAESTIVKESKAIQEDEVIAPVTNTVNSGSVDPAAEKKDSVYTAATPVLAEKEKKDWSNAAKGAVIGGAGGAIGGAVISKNKVKGAIIGGVIGAAGGYIFGKTKDNQQDEN